MIKKNTKVIFKDGEFAGEYDWQGGIPLSEGENMSVGINGKNLIYQLEKKTIHCEAEGEDQTVNVEYTFKLV